jgi:hypothetical protein
MNPTTTNTNITTVASAIIVNAVRTGRLARLRTPYSQGSSMKEVLLRLDHHAAKSLRSTESQQVNLNRCPTEQHLEETQRRWLAQICQD